MLKNKRLFYLFLYELKYFFLYRTTFPNPELNRVWKYDVAKIAFIMIVFFKNREYFWLDSNKNLIFARFLGYETVKTRQI